MLKLKRNVYGQKQAGRVWNQYMDQGMRAIGFTLSKFDPCLYYRDSIIFLVYIGDYIVFGPDDKAIDEVVDRIPSTTPGAEPPKDAKDSSSARSHSTHLETSSSNRP